LGDSGKRRATVVGGGVAFAAGMVVVGSAWSFLTLFLGLLVLYCASGAFVGLSQATLMDLEPDRHERNMTRWTIAGSVGALAGPLALAAMVAVGAGWRPLFLALAVGCLHLAVRARSLPHDGAHQSDSLADSARSALRWIRNATVLRWLFLLAIADLMGDVLVGYIALYLVDAAHARPVLRLPS